MSKILTLTLREILASYETSPQLFLCHSVRAVLADKNGEDNWGEMKIPDLEDTLYKQLSQHAPYLFEEFDIEEIPGVTVLDDWLNWGYACLIDELDGLWRYDAATQSKGIIQRNCDFRKRLIEYIIKHDGDCELKF